MERDQATKFINDLLKLMVSRSGSDLFITGDFPPAMNFLSSLFRTRAAGKIWYHATLTSD